MEASTARNTSIQIKYFNLNEEKVIHIPMIRKASALVSAATEVAGTTPSYAAVRNQPRRGHTFESEEVSIYRLEEGTHRFQPRVTKHANIQFSPGEIDLIGKLSINRTPNLKGIEYMTAEILYNNP